MSNEDWSRGYKEGFEAGYKMGKEHNVPTYPTYPTWPLPDVLGNPPQVKGHSCRVCGMFFEVGKAYGYSCGNSNCPSKVMCTTGDKIL